MLIPRAYMRNPPTPLVVPISGRYYGPRSCVGGGGGATTTRALGANGMYAVPFWVMTETAFDRIALNITVAGAGGSTCHLGIYAAKPDGKAGGLLVDSGALALDATAPDIIEATIAVTLYAGNLYWLVVHVSAAVTVTAVALLDNYFGAASASDTAAAPGVLTTTTYAALPATAPTLASYLDILPNICLRAV